MTTPNELYIEKLYAALCKLKNVCEPIRDFKQLQEKSSALTSHHQLAQHVVVSKEGKHLPFDGMVDFIAGYVEGRRWWGALEIDKASGQPIVRVWEYDTSAALSQTLAGKGMNKRFGQMVAKIAAQFVPASSALKVQICHKSEDIKLPQVHDAFELPEIKPVAFKSDSKDGIYPYLKMVLGRKVRLFVEQAIEDKCDVLVIATSVQQVKRTKGLILSVKFHYEGKVPDWEKPFTTEEDADFAKEQRALTGGPTAQFDDEWEQRQQQTASAAAAAGESKSTST